MQYFDVVAKVWKPLVSTVPSMATNFYHAVAVGSNLFVAGFSKDYRDYIYRYDTERNVWDAQPHTCGVIKNLCVLEDFMHAFSPDCNKVPQRYNFAKCQWQTFAKVGITTDNYNYFHNNGTAVLNSKVYVFYGNKVWETSTGSLYMKTAVAYCFDPTKNEWETKARTCHPHFGSSLFVVNGKLYVAGGKVSIDGNYKPCGNPAPVEVFSEEKKHLVCC